jgi:hypothetical protein
VLSDARRPARDRGRGPAVRDRAAAEPVPVRTGEVCLVTDVPASPARVCLTGTNPAGFLSHGPWGRIRDVSPLRGVG